MTMDEEKDAGPPTNPLLRSALIGYSFDMLALAGLALVDFGVWCIYPPLGPILLGAAFMAVGVLGARLWAGLRDGAGRKAKKKSRRLG